MMPRRHPLTPTQLDRLVATIMSALLVTGLFSLPDMGGFGAFVIVPIVVWLPHGLYVLIARPELRRWQATRLGAWLAAAFIILSVQSVPAEIARHTANGIVAQLDDFAARAGRYPESLAALGFDQQALWETPGHPHYHLLGGKPHLSYADHVSVLSSYDYDFENREWRYHPD